MGLFGRLLIFGLIWLLPATSYAQFVSIEQAKQTASLGEQGEFEGVLNQISDKGSLARRQVQSIFAEAVSQKLGNSAAGRRIESLIGKLKADLNAVVNDYAKKNPPGGNLRAAFNLAQDTLNGIRRQASEALDQIGFDKAASPNKLSGKYLEYQDKIKELADKGLATADERLADRGTTATLKKELDRIIQDIQQRIEIATTAFLTSNGDVLPSAIERLKKGVLDELANAMAERFKIADARGSDKALDLSAEDLREVEAAKKEIVDITDRAINTIQGLMEQVAASNLPTSSNIVGVNPLLEAKFRVQKQATGIQATSNSRIKKISDRFAARTDVSALAKEVLSKEIEREKNRLNDTITEFDAYFLAGDPTRRKYNQAKRDARDEAAGCTSFLCDIGRAASGVGSLLVSKAVPGLNLAPQVFTNILGIKDPQGYLPSRYTGGYYGGTYSGNPYSTSYGNVGTPPFNPNCYGQLPGKDTDKGFALIEKAFAQTQSVVPDYLQNQYFYQNLSNTINSVFLNRSLRNGSSYFGNCFGGSSYYGGLPGFSNTYNSRFGAYPVGQYLGYPNNNLQLTLGADPAPQLITGFGYLANSDPSNATSYQKVIAVLNRGPIDSAKLAEIAGILNKTDFNKLPGSGTTVASLFYNMCTQVHTGQPALIELCKALFKPVNSVAPQYGATPQVDQSNSSISQKLQSDVTFLSRLESVAVPIKCDSNKDKYTYNLVQEISSRANQVSKQTEPNGTYYNERFSLYLLLSNIRTLIEKYNDACKPLAQIQVEPPDYGFNVPAFTSLPFSTPRPNTSGTDTAPSDRSIGIWLIPEANNYIYTLRDYGTDQPVNNNRGKPLGGKIFIYSGYGKFKLDYRPSNTTTSNYFIFEATIANPIWCVTIPNGPPKSCPTGPS